MNSRDQRYGCNMLVNCVDALLDPGKTVETTAVLERVDALLRRLESRLEWLRREVEQQATRLISMTTDIDWLPWMTWI